MLAFLFLMLSIFFVGIWTPQIVVYINLQQAHQQYALSNIKFADNYRLMVEGGDVIKITQGNIYGELTSQTFDYRIKRNKIIAVEQGFITACKTIEQLSKSASCTTDYAGVWSFVNAAAAPNVTGTVASVLDNTSTNTCLGNEFTCVNRAQFGRCLLKNMGFKSEYLTDLNLQYILRESVNTRTMCATSDIIKGDY